jgi:hypothetical protein
MSVDQDVRRQRAALAEAVNRHDVEAVKRFVHPSYVGRTKAGVSSGYQDLIGLVERLLAPGRDFEEVVEVEDVVVSGDRAQLAVRRNHVMTGWLRIKHRVTTQAVETWWNVDGRWQLVEEQER